MISNNLIFSKPITKIPDKLIYLRGINTKMKPVRKEFVIFSTKGDKGMGILKCHEQTSLVRKDYKGKTLAIDFLLSTNRGKGFGKSLIEFAKNYSKQVGCNGYIILDADPSYTPNRVPHLFYRKLGFSTLDKKLDSVMDKFIKEGKDATHKDFGCELMFFPAPEKEKSWFEKIISWFKK